MTDLGSKKPLQLAHFGYEDAKILGTKVWGGSLDFNLNGTSKVNRHTHGQTNTQTDGHFDL